MNKRAAIESWMRANVGAHVDRLTGEVDATGLAEDWDRSCSTGGATLDPDHVAWEVAAEVAAAHEERVGR